MNLSELSPGEFLIFGHWSLVSSKENITDNEQLTTDNCTGEAFGELFLAMTNNLSSKCFAPTDNCTGEAFGELFLAMTNNLSSKCFAPTDN
jgi:hypothetical protein